MITCCQVLAPELSIKSRMCDTEGARLLHSVAPVTGDPLSYFLASGLYILADRDQGE